MISTILTTFLTIDGFVLLVLIVLLQQGQALGGSFGGGSSNLIGSAGGVKAVVKATWVCVMIFFLCALSLSWIKTHNKYELSHSIENKLRTIEEKK